MEKVWLMNGHMMPEQSVMRTNLFPHKYDLCCLVAHNTAMIFVFVSFFNGAACFFAGSLAFHLLYLDELRLFDLFCLTLCDCDHSICISCRGR